MPAADLAGEVLIGLRYPGGMLTALCSWLWPRPAPVITGPDLRDRANLPVTRQWRTHDSASPRQAKARAAALVDDLVAQIGISRLSR